MDNYRRFASKYNGSKPKMDPLLQRKLEHEVRDTSPGRLMISIRDNSMTSLDNISVKYNEGGIVGKRNHFKSKSSSLRGPAPASLKPQKLTYMETLTRKSGSPVNLAQNDSNDISSVLEKLSET